ncbi:hypothetical protein SDC9_06243 [bioreactor metagenome]|uniref:Uncharacterized protein n=1 Tax=bioreactor metagenome TaxID=1076179 RepID=A0A644T3I9_9ZZZZ|nr:hypothetical protein [Negativicutes bacterium]
MLSSIIVSLVAFIVLIFFVLYKRNFLSRIINNTSYTTTNEFKLQLEQTADAVIVQLEARIGHLETLLEEADYKIIELERRLKSVDAIVMASDQKGKIVEQYAVLNEVNTEQNLADKQRMIDAEDYNDKAVSIRTITEEDDKRQLVLAMAEQGYNITEIAKATGKGKGEIMLFLQLNKR